MKTLNDEQRRALDLHVHCAVHANAGSGKTSVLTERFVSILTTTNTPIEQIVAITFTRAAAAEMRDRVRKRLVVMEESGHPRAHEWITSLGRATIVTIHAYCAAIVRQYADLLDLEADVRDIDGAETRVLRQQAVQHALRSVLSPTSPHRDAALRMFDEVSTETVQDILLEFTASASLRRRMQVYDGMSAANVWQFHQETTSKILSCFVIHAARLIEADVPALNVAEVRGLRDAARTLIDSDLSDHVAISSKLSVFLGCYNNVFTKSNTLFAAIKKKVDVDVPIELSDDTKRAVNLIRSAVWDAEREHCLAEVLQVLSLTGSMASDEYQRLKRERNVIDFDDMIQFTDHVLQHEEVVTALRRDIRYVMVDEFQDTDPGQYSILRKLIPALEGLTTAGPNVFVVGDDKQSIYGFREADVRLFRSATRDIARANLAHGTDNGFRPLASSYRMHQQLCSAINQLCSRLFTYPAPLPLPTEEVATVEYSPLVAGLEAPDDPQLGTLCVADFEGDEPEAIAGLVVDVLCGRLQKSVAEYDRSSSEWIVRPPKPSDIAVLVRKNKDVRTVATALRVRGVPVQVHGGKSFFSRPEVADIRALILACSDPLDNLATATLLRSPILRCSDAEITACALEGRRTSMQDGLAILAQQEHASESIRAAARSLSEWTKRILEQSLPEFVVSVLTASGWYHTLNQEERREQILANVDKALTIIRTTMDNADAGIRDVVDALDSDDDAEREGATDLDPNSVQVMTIHASKGLEFNIVFLAGLNGRDNTPSYVSTDTFPLTCQLSNEIGTYANILEARDVGQSLTHTLNGAIRKAQEDAELQRVLYVALTRARMHAVVSLVRSTPTLKGAARTVEGALKMLPPNAYHRLTASSNTEPYVGNAQLPRLVNVSESLSAPPPALLSPTMLLHDVHEPDFYSGGEMEQEASAALGVAIHEALAHTIRNAAAMNDEDRIAILVSVLRQHNISREQTLDAVKEIETVFASDVVRQYATELRMAHVETRLVGALDQAVFQGVLDVRFAASASVMEVWDWKSNVIRAEEDIVRLSNVYRVQMAVYAWLCMKAFPEVQMVRTRLIFTKACARNITPYSHTMEWATSDIESIENYLREISVPAA